MRMKKETGIKQAKELSGFTAGRNAIDNNIIL
jgi:hypothetical protein